MYSVTVYNYNFISKYKCQISFKIKETKAKVIILYCKISIHSDCFGFKICQRIYSVIMTLFGTLSRRFVFK